MEPRPNRMFSAEVALAELKKDIEYLTKEVADIKALVSTSYVTREEFDPVKRIVYGIVTLILVGVVGALLALVLK